MRRLIFSMFLTCVGLIFLVACAGVAMTDIAPISPTNPLFPIQRTFEISKARLIRDHTDRAYYLISLADRRAHDLENIKLDTDERPALIALNQAFDQAQGAIQAAPQENQQQLIEALVEVAENAYNIFTQVPFQNHDGLYEMAKARLDIIRLLLFDPKVSTDKDLTKANFQILIPLITFDGDLTANTSDASLSNPLNVQFPPGSPGAAHAFFPLLGQHALLGCEQCHINGQFSGTSTVCVACHANVVPISHYQGDCSACHTPNSWKDIHFNHAVAGATNCQSCHNPDKPANHFNGQCSSCHNTTAWRQATFNHKAVGATDCQGCHLKNKPANHYLGQCSACHNTSAWRQATFNHEFANATDCQSCHNRNKPANHFSGQCSSCHNTSSWKQGSFNHQAMGASDCQNCHANQRPANHFSGQCSECHNTSTWKGAGFNHAGQTDCQSCHNRPSGHYGGQCSTCHSTSAWKPASFNHAGQTDCQSCHNRPSGHYGGQCSTCHNTSAWKPASFNHAGQTDCQSCHLHPANHWSGQCSTCHNTGNWGEINVSGHTFPMNHKGANGQCSVCHPSKSPNWTCYNCHNQSKTESKHAEKGIYDIANRCIECHPNGKKD